MQTTPPRATYRLQLSKDFDFDAATARADYLAALGVSHVYCSPLLQATAGSAHGYDIVDPTQINAELGGAAAFGRFAAAMHQRSIEVLVDIVPNHMATAGRANPWWWDLLSKGQASRFAGYFDIDWHPATSTLKDKVLLGVLGDRYGHELERGALTLERQGSELVVRYRDQVFPISAETIDGVDVEATQSNPDALDRLLERQHYRMAYWRSAQEELNYRRFFTIDTLIGLRVEKEAVFEDSHRLILDLVQAGAISGLRVDHIDGLRDPAAYMGRLRAAAPDAYIVVEKVLGPKEELWRQLPVQGTTGYDFIAIVDSVFVDPGTEPSMTALYHAFSGEAQPYPEVVRASKLEISTTELAPDFERLTEVLVEICDADRRHRDRTRRELLDALHEMVIGFRVYRTYVTPAAAASESDRSEVQAAVDEAARRRPDIDPDLLRLIRDVVLLERRGEREAEFAARFQQLTPAVMAKGVEDTAFYRYHRLVSLNEVGGDPGTFGRPLDAFHEWCARTAKTWPDTMLTLSTHDTKRSGDARARLNLLSEIPEEWESAVRRWAEHNDRYRTQGYPDRNLEYLAYQTLVGAWPLDADRLTRFLQKAAREAKVHTSWINPVAAYEEGLARFVAGVMSDSEFTSDVESFLGRHQLVALGRVASLAQTTLLLTCPGVPDIYQGSELWTLSLVDPDNRQPVDFDTRQRLLTENDFGAAPKLWLLTRLLHERSQRPELFAGRQYTPLRATGAKAGHALGFVRDALLVLVPRLVVGLGDDWGDTQVDLPGGHWRNLLTGAVEEGGRVVAVSSLVGQFPVAVLAREP